MKRSDHGARCKLSAADSVSKRSLLIEIITRPIGWGGGAVAASVVGLIDLDLVSAFVLGFIVGLVHDLVLYYLRVIGFSTRIRGIRFEDQFARASRAFSEGDWQEVLPVLEEMHRRWPSHKGTLYLLIRCYDKAGNPDALRTTCGRYLMMHPRQDEIAEIRGMLDRADRRVLSEAEYLEGRPIGE